MLCTDAASTPPGVMPLLNPTGCINPGVRRSSRRPLCGTAARSMLGSLSARGQLALPWHPRPTHQRLHEFPLLLQPRHGRWGHHSILLCVQFDQPHVLLQCIYTFLHWLRHDTLMCASCGVLLSCTVLLCLAFPSPPLPCATPFAPAQHHPNYLPGPYSISCMVTGC